MCNVVKQKVLAGASLLTNGRMERDEAWEGERGGRLGTAAQTAGNTVRSICPSFGFTLRSKFHQLAEVTLHAHTHTQTYLRQALALLVCWCLKLKGKEQKDIWWAVLGLHDSNKNKPLFLEAIMATRPPCCLGFFVPSFYLLTLFLPSLSSSVSHVFAQFFAFVCPFSVCSHPCSGFLPHLFFLPSEVQGKQ